MRYTPTKKKAPLQVAGKRAFNVLGAKKNPKSKSREKQATEARKPKDLTDRLIHIFHKLSRADFCFIVFGLSVFETTWVLLPLAAIGAQLYWMTDLLRKR